MGSSDTEMEADDHMEEESASEEGDTPSPGDDHNQGSKNVNANGNGNAYSAKPVGHSKAEESGERKAQNGAEPVTPRISGRLLARSAQDSTGGRSSNGVKRHKVDEDEELAGTKEEQAEFLKELETFCKERYMDFKLPKFYQEPLNLLKLWRSVLQLGGYDRVTFYKLWRQIGESFHPPKTCTTVSWTFRIFYEKSLLEYEKHKREIGELVFPDTHEPPSAENEAAYTSSGRVRRESATRAMQGWHSQRETGFGEVGEPIVKDKNLNTTQKREKPLKNIGLKQKKSNANLELAETDVNAEMNKPLVATVVDLGPPADWVKINVRESGDCFEVYALVPGLLREEVRVQSDPCGRVVISGQPEQEDNPWGITAFKKVVNLPGRIDPLHTSAVVSLHGRLFVRVPFDR